ncbi:MAG TPA: hypothetical protein VHX86_20115 [Tepidisphaeraceae bacterium]|jgi:hypothetical protein|nr:hypothetical protein [Tepidisphaeraceae bacterium]
MAEGNPAALRIPNTTSVMGKPREVWVSPHLRGRVVLTIHVGDKPVSVVIPVKELHAKVDEIDQSNP